MAIHYELTGEDKDRLSSWHWLHFPGEGGRHLYTMTGVVRIGLRGASGANWRKEEISLNLPFPAKSFPPGKVLQIDYCTPFFALSSIFNDNHAVNAGWAVDAFQGPGSIPIRHVLPSTVWVAVRDVDGVIFSLSFNMTVAGRFVNPPQSGGDGLK